MRQLFLCSALFLAAFLGACTPQIQSLCDLPSQFVSFDDSVKVHYKVWNNDNLSASKPTICFVHGFGCDINTWENQFDAFKNEEVKLVFVDLPGYGGSSMPHVDYTELETCGHFIQMEQPDIVNEKIKSLVDKL